MDKVHVIITDEFATDTAQICSDRVFNAVYDAIDNLTTIPELGSTNVPTSVLKRYGNKARKIVVSSFDVFYTYDEPEGVIKVLALVHQRRVR